MVIATIHQLGKPHSTVSNRATSVQSEIWGDGRGRSMSYLLLALAISGVLALAVVLVSRTGSAVSRLATRGAIARVVLETVGGLASLSLGYCVLAVPWLVRSSGPAVDWVSLIGYSTPLVAPLAGVDVWVVGERLQRSRRPGLGLAGAFLFPWAGLALWSVLDSYIDFGVGNAWIPVFVLTFLVGGGLVGYHALRGSRAIV